MNEPIGYGKTRTRPGVLWYVGYTLMIAGVVFTTMKVVGHLKQEHGMDRNHLLGREGDRINALLTGCGFNLRKLRRFFKAAASLQPA